IYGRAAGNPLLIEELCKLLCVRGALRFERGHWHVPLLAELDLPATKEEAAASRLAELTVDQQALLQRAALLGLVFDPRLLAVAPAEVESVHRELAAIQEAQLLGPVPESDGALLQFSHELIRQAALLAPARPRLQSLYRQLAEALAENLSAEEQQEWADWLGRAFSAAGRPAQAGDYFSRAGDLASRLCAVPEAVAAYRQAASALANSGEVDRAEALRRRARALLAERPGTD
ncbi:MAG: hypothetical protein R3300_15145, partial [Candidatus Promineifilaceae bacterium]|nr:hypothetical protein [Candidatus Promineifilaceae bacterium]